MRVIIISIYICLNAFLYGNEKDSDDLLEQAKDIDKKIESLEGKPAVNDSDSENIEKVVSDEPSDHNQSEANIDNSSTEDNGSTNDKLRNELTEKVFEWNTVVLKLLPPITQQMMNVNLMFVDEDSFKSLALVEDIKEDADGKKQLLKKMSEKARNVLNLLPDFDLRKLSSEI